MMMPAVAPVSRVHDEIVRTASEDRSLYHDEECSEQQQINIKTGEMKLKSSVFTALECCLTHDGLKENN